MHGLKQIIKRWTKESQYNVCHSTISAYKRVSMT